MSVSDVYASLPPEGALSQDKIAVRTKCDALCDYIFEGSKPLGFEELFLRCREHAVNDLAMCQNVTSMMTHGRPYLGTERWPCTSNGTLRGYGLRRDWANQARGCSTSPKAFRNSHNPLGTFQAVDYSQNWRQLRATMPDHSTRPP